MNNKRGRAKTHTVLHQAGAEPAAPNPAAPAPLAPFAPAGPHHRLRLTCSVERAGDLLAATWLLSGDISALALPPPAAAPRRRDGLWRGTCFELFFGQPGHPEYHELNLAPSGDWNAYRFDGPRRGGRAETRLDRLPFTFAAAGERLEVQLRLSLTPLALGEERLEVGPAAVLAGRDGALSHWALRHEGPAPDFHRRGGFLLPR